MVKAKYVPATALRSETRNRQSLFETFLELCGHIAFESPLACAASWAFISAIAAGMEICAVGSVLVQARCKSHSAMHRSVGSPACSVLGRETVQIDSCIALITRSLGTADIKVRILQVQGIERPFHQRDAFAPAGLLLFVRVSFAIPAPAFRYCGQTPSIWLCGRYTSP